jgi:hypothetical protein
LGSWWRCWDATAGLVRSGLTWLTVAVAVAHLFYQNLQIY